MPFNRRKELDCPNFNFRWQDLVQINKSLCSAAIERGKSLRCSPGRFIRLYDNVAERCEGRKKGKRKRWREQREEEVKDSREKEFIEAYISSLADRGETL